jgi:hypothetical protein
MKKFMVVVIMFYFLALNSAKAEVIWTSGFESGNFSDWTSVSGNWKISGGEIHYGVKRAQVDGTSGVESILLLTESTIGYKNINLDYWFRVYAGLEADDFLYVEYTANGEDWQNLKTYTNLASNANWQEESFLLPSEAEDNPLFGFRLRAVLGSGSDCMYFDDVFLSTMVPEPNFLFLILPILLCIFCRCKTK